MKIEQWAKQLFLVTNVVKVKIRNLFYAMFSSSLIRNFMLEINKNCNYLDYIN